MSEELTLDSFRPLIEAEKERYRVAADFLNAQNRARGFLRDVRARQKEEQRKLSEMLSDLKAEEQRLRQKVRAEATARAKATATPRTDTTTGARLAVLPGEMAAIGALITERRMTDEERAKWTETVMYLRELEDVFEQARRAANKELVKWKTYFFEAVNYPKCGANYDISSLISEGYALNKDAD